MMADQSLTSIPLLSSMIVRHDMTLSCCCVPKRQMILTGCVAFARHVGPTRVEAELLPQCWEQVQYTHTLQAVYVIEYAVTGFL